MDAAADVVELDVEAEGADGAEGRVRDVGSAVAAAAGSAIAGFWGSAAISGLYCGRFEDFVLHALDSDYVLMLQFQTTSTKSNGILGLQGCLLSRCEMHSFTSQ